MTVCVWYLIRMCGGGIDCETFLGLDEVGGKVCVSVCVFMCMCVFSRHCLLSTGVFLIFIFHSCVCI